MSTGTETIVEAPPTQCEAFIDGRLKQTRRHVKGVDIAGGLMTLAIGVLAYLLAATLIDHWLVPGGLGFWGRLLMLAGLIAGAGVYFARCILPPVLRRINPIYAAQVIEKSRPSLKNGLINLLLLRSRDKEVSKVVYRAMQNRAASDLSQVDIEVAVDRTHVLRLGYALAGLLAVCALYLVISPKSTLGSAARVIWPWANIQAPTRVTIEEIKPGDAVAFHGDRVAVSAEIRGLQEDDRILLKYSTADGQVVEQAIPLRPDEDGYPNLFECKLPPDPSGLQQDVDYFLTAGDCTTRPFRIEVQTAPEIAVESIEYAYPEYTGIERRTAKRQGDILAVEGTTVTINATANRDIKRAEIDLDCDGQRNLKMKGRGLTASGRFKLRLCPEEETRGEHVSYQLRFTDLDGRLNPRPIRHRIEVIRDMPPTIDLVNPKRPNVQVAEDGRLDIRVRAEDPDFALSKVAVRAEHAERSLPIRPLLDEVRGGDFEGAYAFEPARLGLKAGDRVLYWAEAVDNKQPKPGRAETAKQWITIVGPESLRQQQEEAEGAQQERPGESPADDRSQQPDTGPGQQQDRPAEPGAEQSKDGQQPQPDAAPEEQPKQQDAPDQQPDEQGGPSEQSADGGAKSQPSKDGGAQDGAQDESAEEPSEPIDQESNPGDAFEEILKHRQREQEKKQDEPQPGGEQPGEKTQPGEQEKGEGQEKSGDEEKGAGEKQPGETPQPGEQEKGAGEEKSGSQQKGAGEEQPGDTPQPGEREKGAGEEKSGNQQKGAGEEQPGDTPQPGEQEKGTGKEKSSGQQKGAGEEPPADTPQPGQEKGAGKEQPGDTAQPGGEKKSGDPEQDGGEKQGGGREQLGGKKKSGGKEQPGGNKDSGEEVKSGGEEGAKPDSPGAGKESQDKTGSTSPQDGDQTRQKKPGGKETAERPDESQQSDSPGISPKDSDSEGEGHQGTRKGGGEKGGGQQANQPGEGSPGSNTEAQNGGSKGQQPGEGETGPKAGDQVETEEKTGRSAKRKTDSGAGKSGGKPGDEGLGDKPSDRNDSTAGKPQDKPSDGGQPGDQVSEGKGAHGDGNPTTGGKAGRSPDGKSQQQTDVAGGDDPNLDYARKATDMALEHLRDQMEQEDSDLLEKLGWTAEDARKFLRKWDAMKLASRQEAPDPAASESFDDALRDLGLRHRGTELHGDQSAADRLENLRESGRFQAPDRWSDWLRAYTRGVAGSK